MKDREYNTTLAGAIRSLQHAVQTARLNNIDPETVPFVIKESHHIYNPQCFFHGFGDEGMMSGIELNTYNEVKEVVPDVRPDGGGEYWKSRGASSFDVSGFIKSKEAGQRLLRLVKYVLEKDETETWLDYREYEPTWIQFKFSAKEFDCEKLDKLASDNNDIITEDIVRKCVKKDENSDN